MGENFTITDFTLFDSEGHIVASVGDLDIEISQSEEVATAPMPIALPREMSVTFGNAKFRSFLHIDYNEYQRIVSNIPQMVTRFKQCRTHRKKRINKKWAKQYGYGAPLGRRVNV